MTTRKAHTRRTPSGGKAPVRRHQVRTGAAVRQPRASRPRRAPVALQAATTGSLAVMLAGGLVRLGVLLPLAIVSGLVAGLTVFVGWTLAPKRRTRRKPVRVRVGTWASRKVKLARVRVARRLRRRFGVKPVASTKRAQNVVPIARGVTAVQRRGPRRSRIVEELRAAEAPQAASFARHRDTQP